MQPAKKILIASDSFKDCLSSEEVARYLENGIKQVRPDFETTIFPLADGGEGTASSIAFHRGGTWKVLTVGDPLHRPVRSGYLVLEEERTAIIELATASGLELLTPEERNPLRTSTLGTGELIKDALDNGINKIILTIGGSATVDAGTGIASALGFRFKDKHGNEIEPCGGNLSDIAKIETGGRARDLEIPFGEINADSLRTSQSGVHRRLTDTEIVIACDVKNILNGPQGAARVYGPQKGAGAREVDILEKGLRHLSGLVKEDTGFNADEHPGTGAAGGAALFLLAYGNGQIKGGFEVVSELTGFTDALRNTDLVISGEGNIDIQTGFGKVVASVAGAVARERKSLMLVGGMLEGDRREFKNKYGAEEIWSLMDLARHKNDSINNAGQYLIKIGREIANRLVSGKHLL